MGKWHGPGDPFFRHLVAFGSPSKERRGLGHHLRTRLLVGGLVAFPLVVTFFFGRFIFTMLDRWFRPISKQLFGFPIPGAGLLLFLLGLYLLGVLATNVFGGRLLHLAERWVARLPLVGPIYQGARKITEAFQLRGSERFRRVALVPFPSRGLHSVGFVTQESAHLGLADDPQSTLVFVPTTPNPTTGFLIAVPPSEVVPLDLSVEEAVKMLISGGLLTPAPLTRPPVGGGATESERAGESPRPVQS